MTALTHPVAANADQALSAPLGHAARARDAEAVAGGAVVFVTERVGPAFASRAAATQAYGGRLDAAGVELIEVTEGPPPQAARPVFREGRRWPEPPPAPQTVWRLSLGYWKLQGGEATLDEQARHLRRTAAAAAIDPGRLRALGRQPLRPVKAQKALDIGLFETRLPEAPHIVVADE